MKIVPSGSLPDDLRAKARGCLECHGTGFYVDEDRHGIHAICPSCHGQRVRFGGILAHAEWGKLGMPLETPARLIRESERAIGGYHRRTREQAVEDARAQAYLLLSWLLERYVEELAAQCYVYTEEFEEALGDRYYVYEGLGFPVSVCVDQCRWDIAVTVAATVIFTDA